MHEAEATREVDWWDRTRAEYITITITITITAYVPDHGMVARIFFRKRLLRRDRRVVGEKGASQGLSLPRHFFAMSPTT